jgi:hypothetical protein
VRRAHFEDDDPAAGVILACVLSLCVVVVG